MKEEILTYKFIYNTNLHIQSCMLTKKVIFICCMYIKITVFLYINFMCFCFIVYFYAFSLIVSELTCKKW